MVPALLTALPALVYPVVFNSSFLLFGDDDGLFLKLFTILACKGLPIPLVLTLLFCFIPIQSRLYLTHRASSNLEPIIFLDEFWIARKLFTVLYDLDLGSSWTLP